MSPSSNKRVFLFTGKGGVGKTTLCKAFFQKSIKQGLACEYVDFNFEESELFSILENYLTKKLKSKTITKILINSSIFQSMIQLLPNFLYMIFWGNFLDKVRENPSLHFFIDAHSTGHTLSSLQAPYQYKKIFQSGPLQKDCEKIIKELFPLIEINLISLPQKLSLNESLEFSQNLEEITNKKAKLFLNKSILHFKDLAKSSYIKDLISFEQELDKKQFQMSFPLIAHTQQDKLESKLEGFVFMKFEAFIGTGGVGKTTLSFARAVALSKGYKTLIMTIDPSHRLKDFIETYQDKNLTTLIFHPEDTLNRILNELKIKPTRISKLLVHKFSGMNEILSLLEISHQYQLSKFDYIVLDTAPGKHFLDFLSNRSKLMFFLSNPMIKKMIEVKNSKSFLSKAFSKGITVFTQAVSSLTGEGFLQEFLDTLRLVYSLSEKFQDAIKLQQNQFDSPSAQWFLVTDTQQNKFQQAMDIFEESLSETQSQKTCLINKCIHLEKLKVPKTANKNEEEILEFLKSNQESLFETTEENFKKTLRFHEVHGPQIKDHVNYLSQQWSNYGP